ncbi:MAG TPA: hypothetical protein VLJ68_04415 [Chitinophagaceae bacterium]|nr:hypothetical protein [Chitinophagaceae bacterium]
MSTELSEAPAPGSSHMRNMIIGITTTVIVSGLVYLLGFSGKKPRTTKLEKEKATTEAWKTYVTIENDYAKSTTLLMRDASQFKSYQELYQAVLKESGRFMDGMQRLMKKKDMDPDMVTVLKRRADNEKSTLPRFEKLMLGWDDLVKRAMEDKLTEQQAKDSLVAQSKDYEQRNKGTMERALTEIESLANTLSKRYDQPFNIDDFIVIQIYKYKKDIYSVLATEKKDSTLPENVTKDYLVGKWRTFSATITLRQDNSWSWYSPADSSEAIGTWDLKYGQLVLQVEKHPKLAGKGKWAFNLSTVTDTSFSMYLSTEPYNFYPLVRIRE